MMSIEKEKEGCTNNLIIKKTMITEKEKEAFRTNLLSALERRLFFIPSFKIYGGVAGLYDFGPPGCSIKQNIQQLWRSHFILEEGMFEIECPAVTPEPILAASGHVDRFTDYMVTDIKTGDCHRADHLLEATLEKLLKDEKNLLTEESKEEITSLLGCVEELTCEDLGKMMEKYHVMAPETGNEISKPFAFNLMFKTSIGPKGDMTGYLRPETAQGIFVNFRDLLYFNGSKLPFAAAQIGQSFRNEISPRSGLLRVREFTQAEIEHFLNPNDKSHPKYKNIKHIKSAFFSRTLQKSENKKSILITFEEAINEKMIANETLAYFMARTYLFMDKIGVNMNKLRFRQHLEHEMAHYAEDCWDCEIETTYGWIECVGLADRSAYDLTAHSAKSGVSLVAYEKFDEPKMVEVTEIKPNKKELGKKFKKDQVIICKHFDQICEADMKEMKVKLENNEKIQLKVDGHDFELDSTMIEVTTTNKKLSGQNFTPSVIEPSFGIGRIIYSIFEHSFYTREGEGNEQRTVFRFKPVIAPVKATVFSLVQRKELNDKAQEISLDLTNHQISNVLDIGGTSIGKRYARTDEIGVPFAITVDMQVLEDNTVTLRDRDTTVQIRVLVPDVSNVLKLLVDGRDSWENLKNKYKENVN